MYEYFNRIWNVQMPNRYTQQINMLFTWLLALLHMSTKQFPNYTTKQSIPIWSNACSLTYNNKLIITSREKKIILEPFDVTWKLYWEKNDFVFSFRLCWEITLAFYLSCCILPPSHSTFCVPRFFRWLNELKTLSK